MIPVQPQPEPANFDAKVRKPGATFLRGNPRPAKSKWKRAEYWKVVLKDLHKAYRGICAYCAEWIPDTTGEASVDHFVPKSIQPQLAYEWSNYRLSASRYNNLKQDHTDVLDPFMLQADWFVLDIPSLQLKPNQQLNNLDAQSVWQTIKRLRLNDERSISSRQRWIRDYADGFFNFEYLKRNAPFIAHELERQDLVEAIISIVKVI